VQGIPLPMLEFDLSAHIVIFSAKANYGIEGDFSQSQHRLFVSQEDQLFLKIIRAAFYFAPAWLVSRRNAANHRKEVAVVVDQTVVNGLGRRLTRESRIEEVPHQKFCTAVAGEHSPGPVSAVGRGGKPDNNQFSIGIAISGNRFPPISKIRKLLSLFPGDFFPEFYEPGTLPARNDFLRN